MVGFESEKMHLNLSSSEPMPYPVEETFACVWQDGIREARTHEMIFGRQGHVLTEWTEERGAK
jgi:hypothetical protein